MTLLDADHEAAWTAKLKGPFEGTVLWPYLDSLGNVTVATGALISSLGEFESLRWDGGMGTVSLAAEWAAIKAAKPGMLPAYYRSVTSLRMSPEEADRLLNLRIASTEADAIHAIPGLSDKPQDAILGTLDCCFNMGTGRFHEQFFSPDCKFGPAFFSERWAECAVECRRKEAPAPGGIQKSRNDWTASLFAGLVNTSVT